MLSEFGEMRERKNTGEGEVASPIHIQTNATAICVDDLTILVQKTICLPCVVVAIRILYMYDMEILGNNNHFKPYEEDLNIQNF